MLGYENFADYVLEKRMAENQKSIYKLLDDLYDSCFESAQKELQNGNLGRYQTLIDQAQQYVDLAIELLNK